MEFRLVPVNHKCIVFKITGSTPAATIGEITVDTSSKFVQHHHMWIFFSCKWAIFRLLFCNINPNCFVKTLAMKKQTSLAIISTLISKSQVKIDWKNLNETLCEIPLFLTSENGKISGTSPSCYHFMRLNHYRRF